MDLSVDSRPIPVNFEHGMFSVEGNILNEPKSWASLRGMKRQRGLRSSSDSSVTFEIAEGDEEGRKEELRYHLLK
jgi:hypothetical protein